MVGGGGRNYQEKKLLAIKQNFRGGGEWVNAAYIYTRLCTYGNTKGRQAKQKLVHSFPLMIVLPILCDFYRGLRAKLLLPFSAQWLFATCSICAFGQQ